MPATHQSRGPIREVRHAEPFRLLRFPGRKRNATRRAWRVHLACGHVVTVQTEPGQRAYCGECVHGD